MTRKYGLDFGTTNSAIAVYENGKINLLPVGSIGKKELVPTLVFIERDGKSYIGQEAIDRYVEKNVGREIVKTRVWTGQTVEEDYGTVYLKAEVDENIPGRFFQSLKSFLRDEYYLGTDVFGTYYSLEELVAIFFKRLKSGADAIVGQDVRSVTLGRPVFFSNDPKEDSLAEERLREAARLAGFEEIDFMQEPMGAALNFALTIDEPQNILVFDFGGGTLDFCLMKIEPVDPATGKTYEKVLSVGGLVIGGNTFNEDIMEFRLIKHFGSRVAYKSGIHKHELPLPAHLFTQLRSWYTIPQLHERVTMNFLKEIKQTANSPEKIEALITLITQNYGWSLFQEIDRLKCSLSEVIADKIQFTMGKTSISEWINRFEFEAIISTHLEAIDKSLDALMQDAGLEGDQVDSIIVTGGSSLIPAVQSLLEKKFGYAKIRKQNVFSSVVSGLAISAARSNGSCN